MIICENREMQDKLIFLDQYIGKKFFIFYI